MQDDRRKKRCKKGTPRTSVSNSTRSAEPPAENTVRFICRCGKMIRSGDTEAIEKRRCLNCGTSFDETHEQGTSDGVFIRSAKSRSDASSVESDRWATGPATKKTKKKRSNPDIDSHALVTAQMTSEPSVWHENGNSHHSSLNAPAGNDNPAPPTTRAATIQDVDRALRSHGRPAYWRLIGGGSSLMDWSDGLWSVIAAFPFLLKMAVLLTIPSSVIVAGVQSFDALASPLLGVFLVSLLVIPFPLGIVCWHLSNGLRLSATDKRHQTPTAPGANIDRALKSLLRWVLCFLVGPLFLFLGAYFYWLNCGELEVMDWLILVELLALGAGLWFAAILSVELDANRLVPNPLRVLQTVSQLGPRFLIFAGLGLLSVAAPSALLVMAMASALTNPFLAFMWMVSSWCVGLYLAAVVVRVLGTQYRQCQISRLAKQFNPAVAQPYPGRKPSDADGQSPEDAKRLS